MEKSIFEVGKTYSIHTMDGQRYNDATVNAVDNIFISFVYKSEGIVHSKILNMKVIDSAAEEASSTARKKIWYAGTFDSEYYNSPRWGIKCTTLSPEDIELTKAAGTKVFTTEEAAKKYFFTQIKKGKQNSEYYVWGGDSCALYFGSDGRWTGTLSSEYLKFKA